MERKISKSETPHWKAASGLLEAVAASTKDNNSRATEAKSPPRNC
jgi:hypothetical protein